MKFLFWLLIAFAAGWYLRNKKDGGGIHADERHAATMRQPAVEAMVPCAHCATHVPLSETVRGANGEIFCCAEHAASHAIR